MNVCFLSHMFPNSLHPLNAPFMVERAKALAKFANLKVIAPISFFPIVKKNFVSSFEIFDGIKVYHPVFLALPRYFWALRWLPYYIMLKNKFRSIVTDCDILHIEWIYPDAFAVVRFARLSGMKTVCVVHGNEAIDYFGPKKFKKKYIKVLSEVDRIIVVSSDLKNKLINDYFVDPKKISIILNGVDLYKFSVIEKSEARKILNLPQDLIIGICVARLSEEKNLDYLIKAVSILKDDSPYFYIVGEGPLYSKLSNLIKFYKVENRICLVGPVQHNRISLWLSAGDFFCLPSQREGCPVVIHEALACGRPVISTTVGAIPDLVCDENYGILCPPSDSEALANIIKTASNRFWDSKKIAIYGRQFTWDKVAMDTVKIYLDLMEKNM